MELLPQKFTLNSHQSNLPLMCSLNQTCNICHMEESWHFAERVNTVIHLIHLCTWSILRNLTLTSNYFKIIRTKHYHKLWKKLLTLPACGNRIENPISHLELPLDVQERKEKIKELSFITNMSVIYRILSAGSDLNLRPNSRV